MKKKEKSFLYAAAVCLVCGAVFISGGYFYLSANIKKTEKHTQSEPYAESYPENAGVMLDILGSKTLFYFNFTEKKLSVILIDDDASSNSYYGYPVNFTVSGDYVLLAGIIDRAGGIELTESGETLRYTGVQITDLLSRTVDITELKRKIIFAVFASIENSGFQKDDFLYIIENSKTDITVPDCYYWSDYMPELCRSGGIIN